MGSGSLTVTQFLLSANTFSRKNALNQHAANLNTPDAGVITLYAYKTYR
jgi:hypothetical protein